MDKFRKELIELMVAVETEDPRIGNIIKNIKGGFNKQMEFKYGEAFRRGREAQLKREDMMFREGDALMEDDIKSEEASG